MITLDSITQQRRSCRFCRISFFLICVAAFLLTAQIAAAESSEITFLKKLEAYDIADISSYPNDALRVIGFGIIKFLAWMGDSLYSGIMRRELKKRGIEHCKVVYSQEPALSPAVPDELLPDGSSRRAIPGSVSFVPSAAGLILAGEVIKDLALGKQE